MLTAPYYRFFLFVNKCIGSYTIGERVIMVYGSVEKKLPFADSIAEIQIIHNRPFTSALKLKLVSKRQPLYEFSSCSNFKYRPRGTFVSGTRCH